MNPEKVKKIHSLVIMRLDDCSCGIPARVLFDEVRQETPNVRFKSFVHIIRWNKQIETIPNGGKGLLYKKKFI